jgi:hypothetical protein
MNGNLLDFYNKTYNKLEVLSKRVDNLTLYLIITSILYFIASYSTVSSFVIGPVTINNPNLIPILLPVLFAWLLLDLIITSRHKLETYVAVKFIFMSIYIQEIDYKDLEDDKNNFLTRILLPFSYSTELSRLNKNKQDIFLTLISVLLILPSVLFLVLAPFILEYIMLKNIYVNFYNYGLAKYSFWLTIWLVSMAIFYLLSNFVNDLKNNSKQVNN